MKHSIRTFLLINLLLSVIFVGSLDVVAHIYLDNDKIQTYANKQLALVAMNVQTLLVNTKELININNDKTNQSTCSVITNIHELCDIANKNSIDAKALCQKMLLQIWDKNGKLIFPQNTDPKKTIKIIYGFSDQKLDNATLRVFTNQNTNNGLTVAVGEDHSLYEESESQITIYTLLIMLFSLPLLAILIWLVVTKGLGSIRNVVNEVKNRTPEHLQSVPIDSLPIEIQPLILELNNLLGKLQIAFDREERFASDAAHELRTPLAALRAHVHVALNATSKQERDNALNKVITGIERSTHVVNQLLTLTRASKLQNQLKLNPVSLNKAATEIIAELFPIAKKKNIEIELIDHSQKQRILGDPITIGVLIKNLVDNAIRYINHDHGLIQVLIEKTAHDVILKVIDNGPGIPKKEMDLVFERFFRGDTNTQGSGLGLSIVSQIVKQHHAKIKLSTPKSGTGLEVSVTFKKPKNLPTKPVNNSVNSL